MARHRQRCIDGYIPSDVGGWTVREVGIFDADGDLFAVGNYPASEKADPAIGAAKDMYIRGKIKLTNAALVSLTIDQSQVLVTRQYIEQILSGAQVLPEDPALSVSGDTLTLTRADSSEDSVDISSILTGGGLFGDGSNYITVRISKTKKIFFQLGHTTVAANSTADVVFPTTFPAAVMEPFVSFRQKTVSQNDTLFPAAVTNLGLSGMTIRNPFSESLVMAWLAIGY